MVINSHKTHTYNPTTTSLQQLSVYSKLRPLTITRLAREAIMHAAYKDGRSSPNEYSPYFYANIFLDTTCMGFTPTFRLDLSRKCNLHLLSHLAPSGQRLASFGDDGTVFFTETQTGKCRGSVSFDDMPSITCLTWATSANILIGNSLGSVLHFSMTLNPITYSPVFPQSIALPHSSYIQTQGNRPIKAMDFDPLQRRLAIALDGEIQFWNLTVTKRGQKEWMAFDALKFQHNGHKQPVSSILFFGENRNLLAATSCGFVIWTGKGNSPLHYERGQYGLPSIGQCALAPDETMLATSTSDFTILIWPLSDSGLIMDQHQRIFKIPTGRDQANTNSAPVAFLDESVVTADLLDNIYVLSRNGEIKHSVSVGLDCFVRSIWVSESTEDATLNTVNIVAKGPTGTILLIGYAEDQEHDDALQGES
ncbi:hypothetical protein FRC08_000265 [Ceratobasidium sp. 394]|nr:hypothetical protein FRC08_000265 [Ceratobasidium sp. 394]